VRDPWVTAKTLYAIGDFGAVCYAPFGVVDLDMSLPQDDGPCANPVADIRWVGAKADSAQLFAATYAQLGEMSNRSKSVRL